MLLIHLITGTASLLLLGFLWAQPVRHVEIKHSWWGEEKEVPFLGRFYPILNLFKEREEPKATFPN